MTIDPSAEVHATAVVEDGAVIGPRTIVGPYCTIGPRVVLGADNDLKSHVALAGTTAIGDGNRIFPFASIGHVPQDLKYRGEDTRLEIGANNTIRENATLNPGTEGGGGLTRIGDGNLLMMHVHIGHDCRLGNGIVLANAASIGGHTEIGDGAVIGALAGVHQFCRIGEGAMIGGLSAVVADVIPFGTVAGERAHLAGLNLVGLKRRGLEKATISGLRAAYGALFAAEGTLQERADAVAEAHGDNPLVQTVLAFLAEGSSRHVTTPR